MSEVTTRHAAFRDVSNLRQVPGRVLIMSIDDARTDAVETLVDFLTSHSGEIAMRIGTRLSLAAIVAMMVSSLMQAQSAGIRAERELLAEVNHARRNQGLAPLRWNESLAAAARHHAAVMAQHRTAEHEFEGEPGLSARVKEVGFHFSWLSENVTQGPTPEFIHTQFMRSPNHRANILDQDMNSIGVGVVERGGQLFAVEDFAQGR
jgi:uncharacterized protein YkwD